ncbi:MAG: bifunctional isocitrate dehydrogenase kinase/phosphatase [Pseudomonadales bacterium]|jgi:isocitrate dehydrogenase kinase/phosphatase|nr:bifunctional isocitrate dehydrogenase kinase/phosphatase [Pseudomonadales bacterium]
MTPEAIARAVLDGHVAYREVFDEITFGARERFQQADWAGAQQASTARIECIPKAVTDVVAALALDPARDLERWRAARAPYTSLIEDRADRRLAETFFNSVYCRIWDHHDITDANCFVHSAFERREPAEQPLLKAYPGDDEGGWHAVFERILTERSYELPWQDLERDVDFAARALALSLPGVPVSACDLELVTSNFYRNKGAYMVGHVDHPEGRQPLAIVVLNDEQGHVYVDNVLTDEDGLSIVFSFTRSYFMVRAPEPARLVVYLNTLLPGKKRFELWSSIGYYRHGKTEFYRDFLAHLEDSDDPFVTAPGIRGMVMAVFVLPSYQIAFKIIKDRFPPQKDTTRDHVMASYTLVKRHDRVGRMADTQEFSNLRLPKDRFDPELLAELLEVASRTVSVEGEQVLVKHCYAERLMTPLNLYLEQADEEALREALDEYGNAIRQLAAANIFPGDMLLKNFGVTRHGRVVFYDYDEICYLTDVNFRHIPEPQTEEQELASEPWYSVAPNDVFPEEFPRFMFANPRIKKLFAELHGEIFDADYWKSLQRAIEDGQVMDVFPYRRHRRFASRFGSITEDGPSPRATGGTGT